MLQADGYETLAASSGVAALEMLWSGERIDLALVDVMMPDMNGIEVLQEIENKHRDVKVALMSGYSADEVNRLIGDGGSNYRIFWKPFQVRVFLQMIRNVLETPLREAVQAASGWA